MADFESLDPARVRRSVKPAAVQQSKAELLLAIAAKRRAQMPLRCKAPSPPPDREPNEEVGQHSEWTQCGVEAQLVSPSVPQESSEASGMSDDDDESCGESSPLGSNHLKTRTNSRRRLAGRQLVSKNLAGRDDLFCESVVKNSSSRAATADNLTSALERVTVNMKKGAENSARPRVLEDQYEESPGDLTVNIRKRLVKKSTTVDSETDSENESTGSLDPASLTFGDYSSADEGDVDLPVLPNVKSKRTKAILSPKPIPPSTSQLHHSSQAEDEHALPPGIERSAKESMFATIEPQPQPQPAPAVSKSNNTDEQEDMVLVDGAHHFTLQAKTAHMLYSHQRVGIEWLWNLHTKGMGGILGDDMGLGKTMQIASFLAGLFCTGNIKCALIVAPKTLLAHWVKELSVVGLSRDTKDYSGTSVKAREHSLEHVLQKGGILLTTYDMVRCNVKSLRGDFIGRDGYGDTSSDIVTWDYIILDEGHLVKNPDTQRAKSLREIPAAHRIIVSGTPIQNHLQEMWALFDFCCPNLLGDRKEFKEKYERQILAGTDKKASDRQKRIGLAVAEELRQKFAPFFLRRLKSDVFPDSDNKEEPKLSKKNDLIVWLPLSDCQEKLYRAFLESNTADEALTTGAKVLSALTVMKKICGHPALLTVKATNDIAEGMGGYLDTEGIQAAEAMTSYLAGVDEDEGMGEPSCKIAFLVALLENLIAEGHRTLVFAQTQKMLNIIQDKIHELGWIFRRIDGTIKAADREQCVQEFQSNEDIPLFLLTSQVGGLGLTLTGADRVVIVDPAWNPSTDNQSVDRAYRIGQKKNVVVYRLMTCGTIEEKIYRKQVFKGHLMKVATEKKNQMRYFSQGELREMFKVPELGFKVSVTQQHLHNEHSSQHKINKELLEHIEFLEGLGIAGVSHHDLLFTKEAEPLPPSEDQDLEASWEPRNPSYVEQQNKAASKPQNHGSQAIGRVTCESPVARFQDHLNSDIDVCLKEDLLKNQLEGLHLAVGDKTMLEETEHETWMKIEETQDLIKPFGPDNSKSTISTLPGKTNHIGDLPTATQVVSVPKEEPIDVPNSSSFQQL